jgi:hypothetical protein
VGIRKYGTADGDVTGVEQDGITREAAKPAWGEDDDLELAAENEADRLRGDA